MGEEAEGSGAAARPPLLVSIVFHPSSSSARALALALHAALNDGKLVPGLRIPTTFCVEAPNRQPPRSMSWELAERHCVVVLADAELDAAEEWCSFVADLRDETTIGQRRFVPIQLDEGAYPLHERLAGSNFQRVWREPTRKTACAVRAVVVELCRFLSGVPADGDRRAPITLFISHTKADLEKEPRVTRAIIEHLTIDEPVKAWFDSGDIEAGSEFATRIAAGVADSSLLCVLTDSYASREWCRREMLLAKMHQRPVVVVDALAEREIRSFPYSGNVPVLRWSDAQAAVDLVCRETLHHLHCRLVLSRWRRDGDFLSVRPPELATLVHAGKGAEVLYPDPPLGGEETELLAKAGLSFSTPLERLAKSRPLGGRKIALSMSEPTDVHVHGLDETHYREAIVDVSRYLLVQGATLVYGGHLGEGGYTDALDELVRSHRSRNAGLAVERLVNYVGWPQPTPPAQEISEWKPGTRIERVGRPAGVDESLHPDFVAEPAYFAAELSPAHRYAWARGMTNMRETQVAATAARIVIGGVFGPTVGFAPDGSKRTKWYSGRIPGVLEEVVLSVKAGRPLFLVGAFGGVARLVVDLLEGRERDEASWRYQKEAPHAAAMRALYEKRGLEWLDYPEMIALLRQAGVGGVNPLLDPAEHRELFTARDPARIAEIIVRGLGRLPRS